MLTSKLEVLVDFGPVPDKNLVESTIKELKSREGVKDAVFRDGAFMVETVLPNQQVLDVVAKSSGKRAVLQGFGDSQSAVCMVTDHGPNSILGVIRFQQSEQALVADCSVDGLPSGGHHLHVTEGGDLSQGCDSIGGPYNPPHAPKDLNKRYVGDLGNITADEQGRANFRIVDHVLKLSEIIGRGVAITEKPVLDKHSTGDSNVDGNGGPVIACGIIARSAGIFQNPKRICQCDGVVVWDERDRPLAGKGRRANNSCCGNHGGKEANENGVHGSSGDGVNGSNGKGDGEDILSGVKRCCKI